MLSYIVCILEALPSDILGPALGGKDRREVEENPGGQSEKKITLSFTERRLSSSEAPHEPYSTVRRRSSWRSGSTRSERDPVNPSTIRGYAAGVYDGLSRRPLTGSP
jgi:ribosome modulation factor